ncbi:hypothetical protein LCGC14_1185130 [marine sediment metagenome]|uniref:Uncharacterized protein n=1 Tax=marine sediment metagenome TaxID=412755 RepID=A0A0F9M8R4_9ZZZZ
MKFPKKPKYGNILEICRKDFRNFKKDNGNRFMDHINLPIQQNETIQINRTEINKEQRNIENVRALLREGREDIAFSLFFRTFPSCLPHRTRDNK